MLNLIDSVPTVDEIFSVLKKTPRRPLFPSLGAPAWVVVQHKPEVQKWMRALDALAQEEALQPLPPLTDELYALFFKTGERLPFERVYFERRRRLGRAAMRVLLSSVEERPKFIPSLINKISEIMGEESWTFPAHVWTVPSGKDPMMIDLFAAETANTMAELLTLLGAIIPPELARRIRQRLRTQYFENYLKRHAEFTWTSLPMNWNAVCHQGVLGAALAVEEDDEILARMLALAGPCLQIFLKGFGRDGSTSEGPGYWSYGFGRFAELNAQLETATDGALSFFGKNEQIRRIAQFAPALTFSQGHLVNFSDGHRTGRLPASLLAYLGERLDLPVLRQESAALYQNLHETGLNLQEQRCDLFYLSRLFLRLPDGAATTTEPVRPDVFFSDYGAVVSRGTDSRGNFLEFSAKAGNNDEHHNHNDCGSFILNLNGSPAIVEIGAPEYVHGYFGSEKRYTFLAARSLGHSVPLINNMEQSAGAEFAATVLESQLEVGNAKFTIDLTRCYPAQARCHKLIRTFTFVKAEGFIRITDDFELEEEGTLESMVICEAPVVPEGNGVRVDGAGGSLWIAAGDQTRFAGIDVCDYSDPTGKTKLIHRVRFGSATPAKIGRVAYDIRVV
jgi:hypothetical protein